MDRVSDPAVGDQVVAQPTTQKRKPSAIPLTEQILQSLPGSLLVWATVWSAIPLLRAIVYYATLVTTGRDPGPEFLLDRLVFNLVPVYLVGLSLYSAARLARDLSVCRPAMARLGATDIEAGADRPRAALGAIVPPMILAAAYTMVIEITHFGRVGTLAILDVPLALLVNLAVMTFVWVFVVLLLELDRLGRQRLALGSFPEDLSLGLRPIGSLALTGFMLFAAGGVPILLALASSPLDLLGGLAIFLVGVGLFFLSMWRLHRQMTSAKAAHLARTRALLSEAYGPLRDAPSVALLAKHADVLGIAETMQRRAESINEWPLDQGMVTRVALVITGVITGVIVRLILVGTGL